MQAQRFMLLLLAIEFVELMLAFGSGIAVRVAYFDDIVVGPWLMMQGVLVALVVQFCFYSNDLYNDKELPTNAALFRRFVAGMAVAVVALTSLYFLAPTVELGRVIFTITILVFTALFFSIRLTLMRAAGARWLNKRYLVMGTGAFARELGRTIVSKRALGYELVGFLAANPQKVREFDEEPGALGCYQDVGAVVTEHNVDEVVVALSNRRGTMPMEELLELKFRGCDITDGMTFYEREFDRIYVRQLNPSWLIFNEQFIISPLTRNTKRALDIVLALIGLVLTFPLMLVTAILVKATSSGPVFYSQVRAGRFGEPFKMHKFRSMTTDAEKGGKPQFAQKNDPRVTPIGGFMRKTRIDELPQLINILKGDMSLVGPRPERPYFIEKLREKIPFYHHRLQVKPGLTGLAQVSYGYSGADDEDHLQKLQYDLSYIKNLSTALDLSIIAKTVKVVIIGKGAR